MNVVFEDAWDDETSKVDFGVSFDDIPVTLDYDANFDEDTLVYSEETARLVQHLARNPHLFTKSDETSKVFFELLDTSINEDRAAQSGISFSQPVEG